MKNFLKNLLPNLYFKLQYKKFYKNFLNIKDYKTYTEKLYKDKFHVELNLVNPVTFYEKICYLKLFYSNHDAERLIDKIAVKQFLFDKGFTKEVIKQIATFDTFKQFKRCFNGLITDHNNIVVKLNHTSGDVYFFTNNAWRDKKGYPVKKRFVYACLRQRIRSNYYYVGLEKEYKNIKPKILVEEYVPSLFNEGLDEYKFFLNYGEIKMINVVYGRQHDSNLKEAFTDCNLKIIPTHQNQNMLSQDEIKVPMCFEAMKEFCKKTVPDKPLIRVDLMCKDNEFYFCEFTLYDCGGMNLFYPLEYNKIIGDLFDIKKIITKSEQ